MFLYSFLILFLELSLIRFIPANIRFIGYFSNIILLATFLGMGCGMLLAGRRYRFQTFFPYILLCLLVIVVVFKLEVTVSSPDAVFFTAVSDTFVRVEPQYILPLVFLLVALVNIPLSLGLGQLFATIPPLEAYTFDILGSLSGIVLFTALSFLSVSAIIWFLLIITVYSYLTFHKSTGFAIGIAACIGCLALVLFTEKGAVWSPYYKITVTNVGADASLNPTYAVEVNNIPNQYISRYSTREPFYYVPYQLFPSQTFKKILIIGAGTGADTATALGLDPDVQKIDAVEIDPAMVKLGKTLNPDKPFDDPRVSVHIDDGRSFLQNSNEHYDLIVYALTDSLALTAKSSNIRLESFIFTTDAFRLVKNHLTGHGLFALYNYYREDWLIDKIAAMTTQVFGNPPVVMRYGGPKNAAVIMTGPKTQELGREFPRYTPKSNIPPASDNWPFLYLKQPSIPPLYSSFIALLAVSSIAMVTISNWGKKHLRFDLRFFCFGAGFLLLETKSLATFALFFGSTWLVNALVISTLLVFVLLANLLNSRYKITRIALFYGLLFIMLAFQWFVPPSWFIQLAFWPRLIAASSFYFCPIFFANVIFSQLFKTSDHPQIAFGINLLGSLTGGFLEYLSLAVGYQALTGLVILFYVIALVQPKRSIQT